MACCVDENAMPLTGWSSTVAKVAGRALPRESARRTTSDPLVAIKRSPLGRAASSRAWGTRAIVWISNPEGTSGPRVAPDAPAQAATVAARTIGANDPKKRFTELAYPRKRLRKSLGREVGMRRQTRKCGLDEIAGHQPNHVRSSDGVGFCGNVDRARTNAPGCGVDQILEQQGRRVPAA